MTATPEFDRPLRVGVVGAHGRMGQLLLGQLAQDATDRETDAAHKGGPAANGAAALSLAAILVRAPAPVQASGQVPSYGLADAEAFAGAIDVAIDFSAPSACLGLLPALVRHKVAYVVASTGLDEKEQRALSAASAQLPVLVAANTSLGVHALSALVQQAARLVPGWDVEIVEAHHRRKRDAPSGTARALGAAVHAGRADTAGAQALRDVYGRGPQDGPREACELGYSTVRGGDVVGEHTVWFLAMGERLELTHRCTDASTFARGALAAAAWLCNQAAGSFTMADVLRTEMPRH